jgi:hypothetical protein
MCAVLALVLGAMNGQASAQTLDFRQPAQVPPAWVQFAKLVKYRFEEWIAASNPIAARFRVYLKASSGTSDGPPPILTVRAWVNPDGTVYKVSFAEFSDPGATGDLRAILTGSNVGEAPPPDMLQPINLRFSLAVK